LKLTPPSGPSTARFDPSALVGHVRSAPLSTDRNASFRVGGRATVEGPAGLRADVGMRGGLRAKLTFDE
jgi:hypothetical protein